MNKEEMKGLTSSASSLAGMIPGPYGMAAGAAISLYGEPLRKKFSGEMMTPMEGALAGGLIWGPLGPIGAVKGYLDAQDKQREYQEQQRELKTNYDTYMQKDAKPYDAGGFYQMMYGGKIRTRNKMMAYGGEVKYGNGGPINPFKEQVSQMTKTYSGGTLPVAEIRAYPGTIPLNAGEFIKEGFPGKQIDWNAFNNAKQRQIDIQTPIESRPSARGNIENDYTFDELFIGGVLTKPISKTFGYAKNAFTKFKPDPNFYYRGIGKAGFDDAIFSKVLRPKQGGSNSIHKWIDEVTGEVKQFNFGKTFDKTYYSPRFDIADEYGNGYIAGVPKDVAKFYNRYSKGKDWSMFTAEQIPIDKSILLKKHWLKGYKEINPNIQFSQGGEVDSQQIEAEGNETIMYPNGNMESIKGPSHEQGGVPMIVKEGSKIYSDRLIARADLVSKFDKL